MGRKLQTAFDAALSQIDGGSPMELLATITRELRAATKSYRHPWHLTSVATLESVANSPRPSVRTVVLRQMELDPLRLRFHTDRRSPKLEQLAANPWCEMLFYEYSTRIQLRMLCRVQFETSGECWETAWSQTSLSSRRCYLAPFPPGKSVDSPHSNLPDFLLDRDPEQEESEAGRENFAVVHCEPTKIDWLYLKHSGHVRAGFEHEQNTSEWTGAWLCP